MTIKAQTALVGNFVASMLYLNEFDVRYDIYTFIQK